MTKGIRKIKVLMIAVIFALCAGVMSINTNAATGVGYVTSDMVEITQRGNTATVTYVFSLDDDNAPFTSCYAKFRWDASLMTLDTYTTDGMEFANNNPGGIDAQLLAGNNNLRVTLNFKNVLPIGTTATESLITVTFKDAITPWDPEGIEFSGDDWEYLTAKDIVWNGQGGVELKLPLTVTVNPKTVDVVKGNDTTISAEVKNSEGTVDTTGVTWTVTGATSTSTVIDANGKLTVGADETAKTLTVTATSKKDTTKSDTTIVTVKDKPTLSITLTPAKSQIFKGEGGTVQYTATAVTTATTPSNITYSVSGNTEAGTTIDASGLLTIDANEAATELTVTATATNTETSPTSTDATAKVELVEIGLIVNPATVTVAKGYEQDFVATVQNDLNKDGVTWVVTGATSADTKIDANGKLIIGEDETATTLTVTATSVKDTSKSADSIVTVVEAPAITITISTDKTEVKAGTKVNLKSVMENDIKKGGVTWDITGHASNKTKITPATGSSAVSSKHGAVLTVGTEDEGTEIEIKVTSVTDNTKSATAKVIVIAGEDDDNDIEVPVPDVPDAGNNTNLVLLSTILIVSIVGGAILVRNKIKNN